LDKIQLLQANYGTIVIKIVCSGRQQYERDKHIYFYIVLLRFYGTESSSPVITQPLCKNGGTA